VLRDFAAEEYPGNMQVAPKQPQPGNDGQLGQVLQFPQRRRGAPKFPIVAGLPGEGEPALLDDLARYEEDAPIDYRQRTLMNVIALAIVTLLVAAGVWIADTIAVMEKDEDCVMQGRINCAPIELPIPHRQ
jgi:hypothetical protein